MLNNKTCTDFLPSCKLNTKWVQKTIISFIIVRILDFMKHNKSCEIHKTCLISAET